MIRRNRGAADSFLEGLCMYRSYVHILFVISLVMFLLSLISFGVVKPGTETYVVVVLNMIGLGVLLLSSGAVLVACRNVEG